MGSDRGLSFLSRLFFMASFALLAVAVAERLVNYFGYTILGLGYTPGRMLEFAGIMLLFVITILLRQAREELRRKGAA
jgi:hypothetical protein